MSEPATLEDALDLLDLMQQKINLLTADHSYRWLVPILTGREAEVMGILMAARQPVTAQEVHEHLYAHDPDGGPSVQNIHRFIMKIRERSPEDTVRLIYGSGYYLSKKGRAWAEGVIEEQKKQHGAPQGQVGPISARG